MEPRRTAEHLIVAAARLESLQTSLGAFALEPPLLTVKKGQQLEGLTIRHPLLDRSSRW